MTPSLPEQPNLRHLKNQAKAILKSHSQGDLSICNVLRLVPRLSELPDLELLAAKVSLQEVQHALAKSYGFAAWDELKTDVTARSSSTDADKAGRLRIPKATGEPIDLDAVGITRGFRYDPINWVSNSRTLAAAQVRKRVFDQPLEGDEEILDAKIKEILHDWPPEDPGKLSQLLTELLELGVSPDRPEIKEALANVCSKLEIFAEGVYLNGWTVAPLLRGVCMTGWHDAEKLRATHARLVAYDCDDVQADPWVWARTVKALVAGSHLNDISPAVDLWIGFLHDRINAAGCWNKYDPWDMLDAVVAADHPLATKIVARDLPMILQAQSADGGWDNRSLIVFRALVKHGLIRSLGKLPERTADWRVVRTIPAPKGNLHTMTWDGERLWVLDRDKNEAIAVSPEDGTELKRLKVPLEGPGKIGGIGWYDGLLAVTAGGTEHHDGPSRLYLVDTDTSKAQKVLPIDAQWGPSGSTQIGDDLWIAHGCWMVVINPKTGQHHGTSHSVYGSWPHDLAADGEAFWHTDEWAPFLFKSGLKDNLLEFCDPPFYRGPSEELPTRGIAHDGKNLWALDNENKRICIVEKTDSGKGLQTSPNT